MKTCMCLLVGCWAMAQAAPPVVSNIRASQRPGTKLVDVYYDLADADGDLQLIQVAVSADAGLTYGIPCTSLTGAVGGNVTLGTNRHLVWNAGADWNGNWVPQCRVRVTAHDGTTPPAPPGMAYIPAGPFQMGDNFNELGPDTRPVHNVQVAAFFIDKTEVTRDLWEQVKAWGNANGYSITGGVWKDLSHPVHSMTWENAIKWCNARSQKEGLTPCYYTNLTQTEVYITGNPGGASIFVKWSANGYRLPTEAEWEKAARGGRTGQRYPWGNSISTTDANYSATGNPWHTGSQPYTSPVGSYPANDYGLYDMAGNVNEWCGDWYSSTYYGTSESVNNPVGPPAYSGRGRSFRGGASTGYGPEYCRLANRNSHFYTGDSDPYTGFRTVRK